MFAIYIEEYGYYEGKIYQNDNEFYPEAEIHSISEFTKIYEQEYSELSKAYQEKEKIYSANPSIENKFEAEKAESAYITIAYLKDKLMF